MGKLLVGIIDLGICIEMYGILVYMILYGKVFKLYRCSKLNYLW